MVDEFSSFARLPKPVFRARIRSISCGRPCSCRKSQTRDHLWLSPAIRYPAIECDRHQFGQAMTNVLKNAVEAIERARSDARPIIAAGSRWRMRVERAPLRAVTDNGIGLPQDRERIIEPYVTTREKGTGLGLAIVKKIVEEHGGDMSFPAGRRRGTRDHALCPRSGPASGDRAARRR
jgi:two-component system, NtrC family, nitrogen regulation sensor histidine kinase NtrY